MSDTATAEPVATVDVIAEIVKTRDTLGRLRSLGGVDTFFGKEHVFGELLKEEHERAGETNKGCFCFKRLGWYGNIVSFEPTVAAVKSFLAHGYIREDLERLRDWYSGSNQSLDCLSLGVYLKHILLRPDIEALLVESGKRHAEAAEAEKVRLAAIPHVQPPDGAPVYRHRECIEDFAGNSGQPGAWSDVSDKVDDSKCPFCGKVIHPNAEFRDDLSRREFNISGLCQDCQDKTFGK